MNRYKCHKIVEAAKIVGFRAVSDANQSADRVPTPDSFHLMLDDGQVFTVSNEFVIRMPDGVEAHDEKGYYISYDDGGYYVRDDDGYESWSPTEAFEDGYTRVYTNEEAHAAGAHDSA